VSIPLTVTVTGGSGGTPFDPGGSYPNSMPNWASIFPSMNQPQSSSPSYTPIVQQPVPIPPVILEPQSTYVPPVTPVPYRDESKDNLAYVFIGLGTVLVGLILYLLLPDQRVR